MTRQIKPIDFFQSLFGHESLRNMYMYCWALNRERGGGRTVSYKCTDLEAASNFCSGKSDVYFGLALTHTKLNSNERIGSKGYDAISSLWLDIDFQSPYRGKEDLPPHMEAIESVFDGLPEATWQIKSGYGMHFYWVFDEPFIIRTESDRDTMSMTIKRWNAMFKERFKALGYNLDSTSAAQILRVPGTKNGKNPELGLDVDVYVADPNNTHSFEDLFDLAAIAAPLVTLDKEDVKGTYNFTISSDATIDDDDLEIMYDAYPKFKDIWEGKTKYPSQSERDLAIASYCRACGWEDQMICDAIMHNRRILGAKPKTSSRDYLARTLLTSSRSDVVAAAGAKLVDPARSMDIIVQTEKEDGSVEVTTEDMTTEESQARVAIEKIEELTGLRIGTLVKYPTTPPTYKMTFTAMGKTCSISFPTVKELTEQRFFSLRIMENLNVFVPKIAKKKWDEVMSLLLPLCVEGEMMAGASDTEEFRIKINMFLSARICEPVVDWNNPPEGCFYDVEEGGATFVYINPITFMNWHNREGFNERIGIQTMSRKFMDLNSKPKRFKSIHYSKIAGEFDGYHAQV
jgi:hypothetical protein